MSSALSGEYNQFEPETDEIADFAFESCEQITSVAIPDSVKSIGAYAFKSCSNLRTVTVGQNGASVGKGAFEGCSKLSSVIIRGDFDMFSGIQSSNKHVSIREWRSFQKNSTESRFRKIRR